MVNKGRAWVAENVCRVQEVSSRKLRSGSRRSEFLDEIGDLPSAMDASTSKPTPVPA